MSRDITVDSKTFVLSYNLNTNTLHLNILYSNQILTTGQPEVELYSNLYEVIERITELGFDVNDYMTIYEFISFTELNEVVQTMEEINKCLGENYITTFNKLYDNKPPNFESYVILVDDKIRTCLTSTQINSIMTATNLEVTII